MHGGRGQVACAGSGGSAFGEELARSALGDTKLILKHTKNTKYGGFSFSKVIL